MAATYCGQDQAAALGAEQAMRTASAGPMFAQAPPESKLDADYRASTPASLDNDYKEWKDDAS